MAHRASKMLNLPLFYTHLCHEYTYRDYFDSIGKPAPPSESSPLMNIIKNALFASPSVLMIDGLELVDKGKLLFSTKANEIRNILEWRLFKRFCCSSG